MEFKAFRVSLFVRRPKQMRIKKKREPKKKFQDMILLSAQKWNLEASDGSNPVMSFNVIPRQAEVSPRKLAAAGWEGFRRR